MKSEDEQRIQDRIEDRACQHTCHGICRASVRTDQMIPSCSQDQERNTPCGDPRIILCVWQHFRSHSEDLKQRIQEYEHDPGNDDPARHKHAKPCPHDPACLLLIPRARLQIIIRSAPDPKQQRRSRTDDGYRKGYIGRRIPQHPYTLPDKDLVYDIIQRTDKHTDDRRYRKSYHQLLRLLCRERIPLFFYSIHSPTPL